MPKIQIEELHERKKCTEESEPKTMTRQQNPDNLKPKFDLRTIKFKGFHFKFKFMLAFNNLRQYRDRAKAKHPLFDGEEEI